MRRAIAILVLFLGAVWPVHAGEPIAAGDIAQGRVLPNAVVVSTKWVSRIPPAGRVNYPEFLSELYPGQQVAVGIFADGPDRDQLLSGLTVQLRFLEGSHELKIVRGLKPVAIRHIKAEGADFALNALKAAGIGEQDRARLAQKTSLQSMAVIQPDWTAPAIQHVEDIRIEVSVTGGPPAVAVEPIQLKIRPIRDWLAEPRPSQQDVGKYLTRYRDDLPPGRLLSLFAAVANDRSIKAPPVEAFFVFAFKADAAAREAAVEMYPTSDAHFQSALLWVFRRGGYDLSRLFPDLPAATLAPFNVLEPLPDPRQFPKLDGPMAPETITRIGDAMDQCWAGWMATGDASYLRPLVALLENAPDFAAYTSWRNARVGARGLTAPVARGLAYQIAGWSIRSFQVSDPHVADWLLYWENDPTESPTLRREISALPTNPAFRKS